MKVHGQEDEWVRVKLSSGLVLEGPKAQEFKGRPLRLSGRCLDLKAAYKQLALAPADRSNAVIAVLDPGDESVKFFISCALPFGATGAAMAFNRAARAMREVLQRFLRLPVVNYFDDFPHVDVESMAVRSQVVMEEAMRTLGRGIAEEQKKRAPPAQRFVVLGVVIDLEKVSDGLVLVRNKPERAEELDAVIQELAQLRSFPPSMAAKVYGRLNFAEAQCSGRWLAPILEPVKQRALTGRAVKFVTHEISSSLDLAARLLRTAPPRRLRALTNEGPRLVFTDGAYEGGVASCGAVILSPRLRRPVAFGFTIPQTIVDGWHAFGHEQVIAQAEMMPVVMCKRQFSHLLREARVLFFIDNEGVKEAFVSGTTGKQVHVD